MNRISDFHEFFEGMAQLWVTNFDGFIAVAVYLFLFIYFLYWLLMGLMSRISLMADRFAKMLESVAQTMRGIKMPSSPDWEVSGSVSSKSAQSPSSDLPAFNSLGRTSHGMESADEEQSED